MRTRRFNATAIAARRAEMVNPAPAHKAIETAALMAGLASCRRGCSATVADAPVIQHCVGMANPRLRHIGGTSPTARSHAGSVSALVLKRAACDGLPSWHSL